MTPSRVLARRIIAHYGIDAQREQATEELAELVVALSHYRRGRASRADVASEVADVLIVLAQVCEAIGVSDLDLDSLIRGKERRVIERMEREGRDASNDQ